MLVELLQPAGPDLVRRLAAALMLVPRDEREGVVRAIERRVVETYAADGSNPLAEGAPLTHVSAPVQGPGYVEQVETEYERPPHVVKVDAVKADAAAGKPSAKSSAIGAKSAQRRAK